ncbi:unnamed protein product, partial [Allacma fusca]
EYLKVDSFKEEAILVFKSKVKRINTETPSIPHIQIPLVILSQAVIMSKLPEKPNAQKNGGRKKIDRRDSGSVMTTGSFQELNANAIHLDVNNLHSAGRTVLVTNPPESGQLIVGRRIQNYTGTDSTEEIHHVLQDGTTGGNGSVVHNLYGKVNTKGTHIGSTGGMDQANIARAIALKQKSQKKDERSTGRLNNFESSLDASNRKGSGPQGTFTMPNGDGQTFLNVYTGDAQIDNMVTVVKQDDTRDTSGDTFLKTTEVNQCDVVVQRVRGAEETPSRIHLRTHFSLRNRGEEVGGSSSNQDVGDERQAIYTSSKSDLLT